MENKKEKTAPDVSVGADTEQPISKNTISSISENGGNIKSFEELQREMQLQSESSFPVWANLQRYKCRGRADRQSTAAYSDTVCQTVHSWK